MSVSLSDVTQKLIEDRLKRGDYHSADDLVRVALEKLDQSEREPLDDETLDAIDEAEEQYTRGEYRNWEDVRAEIKAKYIDNA